MIDADDMRTSFTLLKDAIGVDDTLAQDDPVWLRLAGIDIELGAAEITLSRADAGSAASESARLKLLDVDAEMTALARDVLGYLALVPDLPGDNEPPIGGQQAKRLRSRFLAMKLPDEVAVMETRGRIAAWLQQK